MPHTSIRLDQLDAQLDYLETSGYRVLPMSDIVKAITEGGTLPDRTVSITIDDAYRSIYDEAYPRLRELGWPFTVFVCTDPVDSGLSRYLTWDQMREMAEHGATFANHSASHDMLIDRRDGETEKDWAERVRVDVERAQRRLEEELGKAPKLFAYPYGEYDEPLAEIISEMGYAAFGQQSGAVGVRSDARCLPRYPMAEDFADLQAFKTKAASLPLDVTAIEPWDPVVAHPDSWTK